MEDQRDDALCPRSHSLDMTSLEWGLSSSDLHTQAVFHHAVYQYGG